MTETAPNKILLASSSKYRKALLSKILSDFSCASPDINEDRLSNEPLIDMSARLATEKAFALSKQHPSALIIGSDQVACLLESGQETQLKKPVTTQACFEQLKLCRGKTVHFYTGLCLLNTSNMHFQTSIDCYETKFKNLSDAQIQTYIQREPALDCAGGFKMEGLGIALFEHIRGDDPNSLIGLPLISLISMLENEGIQTL